MIAHNNTEAWKVTLVDTGIKTMTGGRIKRVKEYIGNNAFMLKYGDGISDVNIGELVEFHKSDGKLATMTAIQPGGRFGILDIIDSDSIDNFREKSIEDGGWINGGFMVLEPEIISYITGDSTTFEKEPLEAVAKEGQLEAFKHRGF